MKILIQRVSQASVEVEGKVVGVIDSGMLIFVGITHRDTPAEAVWLANKLVNLRIFADASGKLNHLCSSKRDRLSSSRNLLCMPIAIREGGFLSSMQPRLIRQKSCTSFLLQKFAKAAFPRKWESLERV